MLNIYAVGILALFYELYVHRLVWHMYHLILKSHCMMPILMQAFNFL